MQWHQYQMRNPTFDVKGDGVNVVHGGRDDADQRPRCQIGSGLRSKYQSTVQTNSYKPQAAACLGFRADTIFARCGCTLVGPSGALDVQISVEQINLFLKIPIITEC